MIHSYFLKRNNLFFFSALILFQVLFLFQGLDLGDSGTYATLYDQIFSSPESLQFMFNYWLTAIIGGLWLEVFPGMGLLGLRVFGIIVTTSSLILVYAFLKGHVKEFSLKTGLFIGLIVQMANLPVEMYYNKLSVFFWIAASFLLFTGLRKDRIWLLAFSGALTGINIFVRLPNILCISIACVIFYYGWLNADKYKVQFRRLLVYIAGLFISILIVGFIMMILGHLKFYIQVLQSTAEMGYDPYDSHNLARISVLLIHQIKGALSFGSLFLISSSILVFLLTRVRHSMNFLKVQKFILISAALIIGVLTLLGVFTSDHLAFFMIGIVLITSVIVVFGDSYTVEYKALLVLGFLMVVLFPFGSGSGLSIPGKYALILSIPLVFQIIIDLSKIEISFISIRTKAKALFLDASELKFISSLFLVIVFTLAMIVAFSKPFNEVAARVKLTYSVEDDKLKGIFTSEKKAIELNEMLKASSKYIYPGMPVLAYADIPMYHYLSETVPFFDNPWPGQYTPSMLKTALIESSGEELPIIIINKHIRGNTCLSVEGSETDFYFDKSQEKHFIIKDFIDSNNYSIIWENNSYVVLEAE